MRRAELLEVTMRHRIFFYVQEIPLSQIKQLRNFIVKIELN